MKLSGLKPTKKPTVCLQPADFSSCHIIVMYFLFAIMLLLPNRVYATKPNCSGALEAPDETKQAFDEFIKFFDSLPEEFRRQIEFFGPLTGWISKEEMKKDMAKGIGPKTTFLIGLHPQPNDEVNFQIDSSIFEPTVRDGKVFLPEYIGKRPVKINVPLPD